MQLQRIDSLKIVETPVECLWVQAPTIGIYHLANKNESIPKLLINVFEVIAISCHAII